MFVGNEHQVLAILAHDTSRQTPPRCAAPSSSMESARRRWTTRAVALGFKTSQTGANRHSTGVAGRQRILRTRYLQQRGELALACAWLTVLGRGDGNRRRR